MKRSQVTGDRYMWVSIFLKWDFGTKLCEILWFRRARQRANLIIARNNPMVDGPYRHKLRGNLPLSSNNVERRVV